MNLKIRQITYSNIIQETVKVKRDFNDMNRFIVQWLSQYYGCKKHKDKQKYNEKVVLNMIGTIY